MNDESPGMYNISRQIKSKTLKIRSNFCDYSDPYIHLKGTITVPDTGVEAQL